MRTRYGMDDFISKDNILETCFFISLFIDKTKLQIIYIFFFYIFIYMIFLILIIIELILHKHRFKVFDESITIMRFLMTPYLKPLFDVCSICMIHMQSHIDYLRSAIICYVEVVLYYLSKYT
jgi:hypothetical protein